MRANIDHQLTRLWSEPPKDRRLMVEKCTIQVVASLANLYSQAVRSDYNRAGQVPADA